MAEGKAKGTLGGVNRGCDLWWQDLRENRNGGAKRKSKYKKKETEKG